MEKQVILYFNTNNELDIKIEKVYFENEFISKSKCFLEAIDENIKWDLKKEPVFISPNCTISRFKVREKTKITHSASKANAIFFDLSEIYSFRPKDFENSNFYSKIEVRKLGDEASSLFKDLLLDPGSTLIKLNKILNFKKVYADLSEWNILQKDRDLIIKILSDKFNLPQHTLPSELRHYGWTRNFYQPSTKLGYDIIDYKTHNELAKIYDIGHLNQVLLGDAIVIDQDKFAELDKMIKTSDKSNIILAMEIMANTKFAESFHYLYILFFRHCQNMNNLNAWNHVNFKSLRKTFEKACCSPDYIHTGSNYISYNLSEVTKTLLSLNQFTEGKINQILEELQPKRLFNSDYFDMNLSWSEKLIEDSTNQNIN